MTVDAPRPRPARITGIKHLFAATGYSIAPTLDSVEPLWNLPIEDLLPPRQ